jgi:hypothetical protein
MAEMPGVQVCLTSIVEMGRRLLVGEELADHFWRKKLNQIRPAQTAIARIAARVPKTCFFMKPLTH